MKHNIVTALSLTALVLSSVIFWDGGYVWIVMSSIVLIYLFITGYGSYQIKANYFISSVNKGKKKSIALTFDDGPDPDYTPMILDILKEKDIKATFFVIGKKAETYPEILRRIHEEGHHLANHSYSHSYFIGFFFTKKLANDLLRCSQVIEGAIGKTPLFFRPPFGVTNPRYRNALKDNNLISIGWSLRSLDTGAKSRYELIDKVISKLKRGDIVLMHDNLPVTAAALEDMVEHIRVKKIEIELLSKVINQEPYVKV